VKWWALLLLGCSSAGQTAWCVRWLACWRALPADQRSSTNDEAIYGPAGECWRSSPEVAKQCDAACANNVVAQSTMLGAPPECR